MKNHVLILIFCLICQELHAQEDTLFVNQLGAIVPTLDAQFYRFSKQLSNSSYEVKEYFLFHKLHTLAHYNTPQMSSLHGFYIQYDSLEKKVVEGNYINGCKEGEWKFYYSDGKTLQEKRVYTNFGKEYQFYEYDSVHGKLRMECHYGIFGRKEGVSKHYFYNSDSIQLINNYSAGTRQGEQKEFYKNGALKRFEFFKGSKTIKSKLYSEEGKKLHYFPAVEYPKPPKHYYSYIMASVPCLQEQLKHGGVKYQLKIHADGTISDIELLSILDEQCKQDFLLNIKKLKKWKPYKRENKAYEYVLIAELKAKFRLD